MIINSLDKNTRDVIFRREALLAAFEKQDSLKKMRRRFAWWPVRVTSKQIAWLEWVNVINPTAKVIDKLKSTSSCIAPQFQYTDKELNDSILLDDDLGMFHYRERLINLKPKVIAGPSIYFRIQE